MSKSVFVIDPCVKNYQTLLAGLPSDADILLLSEEHGVNRVVTGSFIRFERTGSMRVTPSGFFGPIGGMGRVHSPTPGWNVEENNTCRENTFVLLSTYAVTVSSEGKLP